MLRVRDPTKPPYRIERNLDSDPSDETQHNVFAYLDSRESIGEKQGHAESASAPSTPLNHAATPGGTPGGAQAQQDSDSNPVKNYIFRTC